MATQSEDTDQIVVIDDEEAILKAIRRELREDESLQVHIFSDPCGAIEAIPAINPAVVICDYMMPEMNGIEIMTELSATLPDCYRILLTGYADIDSCISAINQGQVHHFIEKPWDAELLLKIVQKGVQLNRCRRRNRVLEKALVEKSRRLERVNEQLETRVKARTADLNRSYNSTLQLLSELADRRMRYDIFNNRIAADMVCLIAEQLRSSDLVLEDLRYAALLRNIGKLGFTDQTIDTPYAVIPDEQVVHYRQHPNLAMLALETINPIKDAAEIIGECWENIDGSGFPAGKGGAEISSAARILRIVNDYIELRNGRLTDAALSEEAAISYIHENSGRLYDPLLIDISHQVFREQERIWYAKTSEKIKLSDARKGMKLAREITLPNGVVLLAAGSELEDHHLQHLKNIEKRLKETLSISVCKSLTE